MSVTVYCIISLFIGIIIGIAIGNFYPFRISSTSAFLEAIHKSRKNATDDYKLAHLNGSWECISYSLLRGQCKIILKKEKNTIIIDLSKGISIGKSAVFSDVKETSGEWTFSIMSQKQQIKQ